MQQTLSATTDIRPLAPSEQIYAGIETYVGYSVQVTGRLDLAGLAAAFDAVRCAHPLMGAQIRPREGGGHILVEPSGELPGITVIDGDPEWLLLDPAFDQRVALSVLQVIRDGARASVTLLTHHSVADAFHSLAVLRDLWSYYTDATRGTLTVERGPMPRSVEQLLAERGVEKISHPLIASRAESPGTQPNTSSSPDIGYQLIHTSRYRLTRAETAGLVTLGHRVGATINGLVSAAILLVEADQRKLPLTELLYAYPVDLRTRLNPKVGLTDGTNVLGFISYAPTVATGPALLTLARDITEKLRTQLALGIVQQTPLHIPDMPSGTTPQPPGMVMATNWGRVPTFRTPPDLHITDFRSTTTTRPDSTTGRRQEHPGGGSYIISTYDNRLSIEIHHPEATSTLQQNRLTGLAEILRTITSLRA